MTECKDCSNARIILNEVMKSVKSLEKKVTTLESEIKIVTNKVRSSETQPLRIAQPNKVVAFRR